MEEVTLDLTQAKSTPDIAATIAALDLGSSDEEEQPAYDDGDLPEFSDTEPAPSSTPLASSSRVPVKLVNRNGPKGKKVPLAKLKKKLGSLVPNGGKKEVEDDTDQMATTGGGGIKLTDEMLDKVMAQLLVEQGPEVAGNIKRDDVQRMVDQVGLNKKVLTGKQGLMGRGTKDAG